VSQKWLPRSQYGSTELLCYSVPARKTDLPGVAQYDLPGTQVGFADAGEISTRSGVLTRTAFEMDGIGDDGVQTRGYLCRRGGRNVAYLGGVSGGRSLRLDWFDSGWGGDWRFLAVSK